MTSLRTHQQPQYAGRSFRSVSGIASGVLLLAIGAWLTWDAVVHGTGRAPWVALGILLLTAPLLIAYTIRPALHAGEAGMLIRNPLRTITIPWGAVEELQARYSTEVTAGGRKYGIWAIPVSLRARRRALHRPPGTAGATQAACDQAVADLRELAAEHAGHAAAQGEVTVRWVYGLIAPAAAGAVLTIVFAALG